MAQLNPATTLPTSSQDALEIFDERYLAASQALLAQPQTWVGELGEEHTTPALSTHYPMSILALKYAETIAGEGRFKTIGEKEVELTVVEHDDGVEIELLKLLTNTFSAKRWADAPAAMLQAEQIFKLRLISAALEANTALCGWDGLALFHDSHESNPIRPNGDTFDNYQATAKDVYDLTDLEEELTLMSAVLDTNGDRLGVNGNVLGVPPQLFRKITNLLKQDFVPNSGGTATMRNPFNDGSLSVVRMDQLTDPYDWYIFDTNLISRGVPPWTVAKLALQGPGFDSLSLRRYGEDSDRFKDHGRIAVSSHVYYGSKFLFPHAIRKVKGS
jgi:hypothetical protein